MKRWLFKIISRLFKKEILMMQIKHLYNTIGVEDILKEKEGSWYFQGRQLNDAEKKLLIAEASQLLSTRLWKVIQTDVKYQINKLMYEKAENGNDLAIGRLWAYTFDTFKTRLNSMVKGSGIFNDKTK